MRRWSGAARVLAVCAGAALAVAGCGGTAGERGPQPAPTELRLAIGGDKVPLQPIRDAGLETGASGLTFRPVAIVSRYAR